MHCSISSIIYSPIKSLSFQSINSCNIKKGLGMLNDRIFAFSRNVDFEKAKLIEKKPNQRKLNYFLARMLKTTFTIVISVTIFGVLFFLYVKRSLKKRLNYYLSKNNKKNSNNL